MSRFVLATLGSLGDVHPYLALGLALKDRGHEVSIATSLYYKDKVERLQLQFCPVRPDLAERTNSSPEVARRAHRMQDGTEYVLKRMVLPYLDETYEDLLRAFRGADVVVSHAVLFATPIAAETLGIKWISVILSPGIFLSAYDPPILPPLAWFNALRHLGPVPHRILHGIVDRITHRWMGPVHELRARAGLPPTTVNPVIAGILSPHGTIAMFSGLLASPQPDWPARTEMTGFTFFREEPSQPLDAELSRFLDDGAPVVFTLASDAVTDAGRFYQESLLAARKVGCRAVFLTGFDPRNQLRGPLPASSCVRAYADYETLFARARAVVHSGGMGTIARSLRAGIPMLVVPFAADQFDNGARVERGGYGLCLWRDRYTAGRAAPLIRKLLSESRFEQRARAARQQILSEDGVARACLLLEQAAAECGSIPATATST